MNNNNINFRVHRTKAGTICELVCAATMLLSIVLSFVLSFNDKHVAGAMITQALSLGTGVLLTLVLAYRPETFNIPDDSPAELFVATVNFLRATAVLMSLLSLGITLGAACSFHPLPVLIGFGIAMAVVLYIYIVKQLRYSPKKKKKKQ